MEGFFIRPEACPAMTCAKSWEKHASNSEGTARKGGEQIFMKEEDEGEERRERRRKGEGRGYS